MDVHGVEVRNNDMSCEDGIECVRRRSSRDTPGIRYLCRKFLDSFDEDGDKRAVVNAA